MTASIARSLLLFFFAFVFYRSSQGLMAQGCSDAGICSIKSFKPQSQTDHEESPNQVNLGLTLGGADHGIFAFGYHAGYSRRFGQMWSLDTRITFLLQDGNDISVSGPGDIYANLNFRPSSTLTFTGGLKIPLTQGDAMYSLKPLPMDYQSSLGTLDLIVGIGYHAGDWQFILGYQQPLNQNENTFLPSAWEPTSPLQEFQPTNMYDRKGDLLLRVSYPMKVNDRFTFTPGLLPIFHVGEDEYTDMDGVVRSIEGSDGLTLNGTMFLDMTLGLASTLQFNIGFPFLVREARPDGLTRGYVLGIGYAVQF